MLQVVVLLITYLIECAFQTKQKTLHAFNMITEINELKTLKGIYHANINVTLMVESVIRIKSGTTINTVVSVKMKKKEIILICDISYESAIGSKPLSVRVDKEDGFIWDYDGTRYFCISWSWKVWYYLL